MQRSLQPRSQLATQGLEILERLVKLVKFVMDKELKEMLSQGRSDKSQGRPRCEDISPPLPPDSTDSVDMSFPEQGLGTDFATFDFVEDPAISQALFDFDQAISGQTSYAADLPEEQFLPDLFDSTGGVAQQQAWIWGINSFAQFSSMD